MRTAHERARDVLSKRKKQMKTMAEALLERETVEGEAVAALLENRWDEFLKSERAAAPAPAAG